MPEYCLDSNGYIEPWKHYPIRVFPSLWRNLGESLASGLIVGPEEVYREIQQQEDGLYQWLKPHKSRFRKVDTQLAASLADVLAVERFARMLEIGRNKADPWVVAHARIVDGGVVVSDEGRSKNPAKKPKVPDVCDHFGVPCIRFREFLETRDWQF
jgi:hypothetical protein